MRFLHTADWHLGRILDQVHLTDDQEYVLGQLVDLVKEVKVDVVLVSGDIYDRAVPPPEAVRLLDDVMSRLVLDLKVPVILIAGNHDSPDRLSFGSRLLAAQGLHVVGTITADPVCIPFEDENGPVHVYALPYVEPAMVRWKLGLADVSDHNSAMRALVGQINAGNPYWARRILMAHAFVSGGEESESERPLSVGGTGTVDPRCFQGFHYVALGHLHRPQKAGGDSLCYSGSLLKYSFSEAHHQKSVSLVEIDALGKCAVERISLSPRRDLRCIKGFFKDLLEGPRAGENRDDYLMVTLLDEGAILDPMGRLREVYPNVLQVDRAILTGGGELRGAGEDHRKKGDLELFSAFFSQVTGRDLNDDQATAFSGIVDSLRQRQREVFE